MKVALQALFALGLASIVGCGGEPPLPEQPCPALSTTSGNLYRFGDELRLGAEPISADLPIHASSGFPLFGGNAVAVPVAGGVTLHFEVGFDRSGGAAVMYLYGPRDEDGVFGGCVLQTSAGRGGRSTSLDFEVPVGQGGEYVLLVGTNPIAKGAGAYSVSGTCEGEACGGLSCEPLNGCDVEVCTTGFVTKPHPEDPELRCPTCECKHQQCPAGMKLVFDTCVCDCPLKDLKPVCGADGKTYKSACFAECEDVAVAKQGRCESVCEPLEGCDLEPGDCPFGPTIVDGCPICECATECDAVHGSYRPVCGTDGFTYLNPTRLACETQDAPEPVGVLSVGACLPFCAPPTDCPLSCPFGYRPKVGTGSECFECACMENPEDAQLCGLDGKFWCARTPHDNVVEGPADVAERLSSVRTFLSTCAAKAADWKPIFGAACPTGVCAPGETCERAQAVLDANLAQIANGTIDPPQVKCLKPHLAGVQVCGAKVPQTGSDCECLQSATAGVYDPVCADGTTYYNACVAFCSKAWPVTYPGTCCDQRLTSAERGARQAEIEAFCTADDDKTHARPFFDTACPPTEAECQAEPARCCFEPKPFGGGGNGGGGGSPPP